MKFFAEVQTTRMDGTLVIWRLPVANEQDAIDVAYSMACEMFGETEVPKRGLWVLTNDFGEAIEFKSMAYGERAQVTEGIFML